ncbi:MAG TPA: hypothetical protein VI485_15885 [Vicinamibacterales bacterium]|nr:hypothetical protein [Vicinamibacterales bacterium]
MAAVRFERGLTHLAVPPLCVLDFDGDLSDHLSAEGITAPWASWACFHTSMRVATIDGLACGIVPRTIGGPYAVLVAEQLWAAGARLNVLSAVVRAALAFVSSGTGTDQRGRQPRASSRAHGPLRAGTRSE